MDERILWTLFAMIASSIIGVTSPLHHTLQPPELKDKRDGLGGLDERNHFDVDTTKELTHISLCAGYGGIDLGLKRVIPNLRTVAFSEIEAYAVANLVAKMEAGLLDVAPIWTDLKTFPFVEFRGRVDILSGGFPCQPFSAAGRRRGDEDPRHLFPYIKRGIALLRPSVVFLENVEGIISSKLGEGWSDRRGTSVLLHVLRELERLDYKATAGIFSAREIGAPHQRKRVFIMGVSDKRGLQKTRTELTTARTPESNLDVFPSRRGEDQKEWEPKRTIKSSLGRDVDGSSDWMDYDDVCESVCNRTDELRLLGNGVVPATAARAFRVLWKEIKKDSELG
jgi:DNA (cytosine-5)-methyltransferase 1